MSRVLRLYQAIYDFWLDLTGVTVGTYRRNVFVAALSSVHISEGIVYGETWGIVAAIPFSFMMLWIMSSIRQRARQDDVDQRAGRYFLVNVRALSDVKTIWITLALNVLLFGTIAILFRDALWMTCVGSAYFTLFLGQCLMVRDRDATRFRLRRAALGQT